jgi:hypothetical protein
MLGVNTTLTALDLADQKDMVGRGKLDAQFAQQFAVGLKKNRALSVPDLSENDIGQLVGRDGTVSDSGAQYRDLPVMRLLSGLEAKAVGAIALADAIQCHGGLVSLNLTNNNISPKTLALITAAFKEQAVKQQRACAHLVGHEAKTKDLRALLVATKNLRHTGWLLADRFVCQHIAMFL